MVGQMLIHAGCYSMLHDSAFVGSQLEQEYWCPTAACSSLDCRQNEFGFKLPADSQIDIASILKATILSSISSARKLRACASMVGVSQLKKLFGVSTYLDLDTRPNWKKRRPLCQVVHPKKSCCLLLTKQIQSYDFIFVYLGAEAGASCLYHSSFSNCFSNVIIRLNMIQYHAIVVCDCILDMTVCSAHLCW